MTDNHPPAILWTPDPETSSDTAIAQFTRFVREHHGVQAADIDYPALHAWSTQDVSAFWAAAAEFLGVLFHDQPTATLDSTVMPGTRWFPGATLNYAEHALRDGPGRGQQDTAVIFAREDGLQYTVTHGELRDHVSRARLGLSRLGVRRGDRVAALAPNSVETLVMFLATASLGAIWSCCSPDFGANAVLDRFGQIEPAVLLAVDGYRYGGKAIDIRPTVQHLHTRLPTLRGTVLVPYLDETAELAGTLPWAEFTAQPGVLQFEAVPFDHPLWVLYSSGTTGLPKAIVHGHGGIVLEHLKVLRLQFDLKPGDGFCWFTTTGWMMWNLLVSGLLVDAVVVLYDGNPGYPDLDTLWRLAEQHHVTYLGLSPAYVKACSTAGLRPKNDHDLSALRAIGCTGSPLSPEGFAWIADAAGDRIQISSLSGGTDLASAFLGPAPTVPVWMGELSCAALGAAVATYDPQGQLLHNEVGELVITTPMPSMPVAFWNDPDGDRLTEAYFDMFPGIWRHGDWVKPTPRGSFVIHGRSDATLNRGGVRMGTADFYRVVEALPEVADSLVIDTTALNATDEGALLCFLVLTPGTTLDAVELTLKRTLRTELSPRHVPDRFVVIDEVPRTLNGKKCELPVKRILAGVAPEKAISTATLKNPQALEPFMKLVTH